MRISDWSSDVCSSDLSQCFGQGAETGTARKVRLTCFRVLKRQHEVDPLLVAGGAWTSSRGSASSARSALVAIAYVQPFYMDRQARIPHRAKRDRACGIAASSHANLISAKIMRSEEHTSELQSLMRISYAVFCLKTNKKHTSHYH